LFKFTLRQKGGIQVFLDEYFSRRTWAAHRHMTFLHTMPARPAFRPTATTVSDFSDARALLFAFNQAWWSWIRPSMTLLPHAIVAVWAEW